MDTTTQRYTSGEPQLAGALAVFPVFAPPPLLAYRSFAPAVEQGALARELEGAASVRALVIENPTDLPLLIYEGEEVLGAQQNRTFDDLVLVASGEKLRVEVSCVEAGRWDGSRRDEPLRPSPQATYPELRRLKRAAASRVGRADQAEVWAAVGDRLAANGVESPSAAMSDIYESRRAGIAALAKAIRPLDGQLGAVAAVAGRPLALDLVSRPGVFASLLPRLAQGYVLDALDARSGEVGGDPAAFLSEALGAPAVSAPRPGMGRRLALGTPRVIGSGLANEDELVQLSAFPADRDRTRGA